MKSLSIIQVEFILKFAAGLLDFVVEPGQSEASTLSILNEAN